jgi:ElaB/YqjD/DUF883 family membrane-anchored ribosome-binding protein
MTEFKDLDSLKEDLGRFRDNIGQMLSEAGGYSQGKIRQTKERLGIAMRQFGDTAGEKMSNASKYMCDKTKQAADGSRQIIVKRPFMTVVTCFAIGALTAYILGKRKNE